MVTNGDMLRQMSDEELATTIMCPNETGMAEIACDRSNLGNCCECCLEWLKEVSESE